MVSGLKNTVAGQTGTKTAAESKKIESQILSSVKVSDTFAKTVAASAGSVVDMTKALAPGLNIAYMNTEEFWITIQSSFLIGLYFDITLVDIF